MLLHRGDIRCENILLYLEEGKKTCCFLTLSYCFFEMLFWIWWLLRKNEGLICWSSRKTVTMTDLLRRLWVCGCMALCGYTYWYPVYHVLFRDGYFGCKCEILTSSFCFVTLISLSMSVFVDGNLLKTGLFQQAERICFYPLLTYTTTLDRYTAFSLDDTD